MFLFSCNEDGNKEGSKSNWDSNPTLDSFYNLAIGYVNMSNTDDAYVIAKDLQEKYKDNKEAQARYGLIMFYIHRKQNRLPSALEVGQEMVQLEPHVPAKVQVDIHFALGRIYKDMLNFNLANNEFLRAIEIGEEIGDISLLRDKENELGHLFFELRAFTEARLHYLKSLRYYQIQDSLFDIKYRQQEVYSNVALTYFEEGENDKALTYYDSCLYVINLMKDKFITENYNEDPPVKKVSLQNAEGVLLGNKGRVFERLGDFDMAEKFYIKSIELNNNRQNDLRDAALIKSYLSRIYILKRKFKEAESLLILSYKTLDSLKFAKDAISVLRLQADLSSEMGNDKGAVEILTKYIFQKDSLDRLVAGNNFISRYTDYQLVQKDNQVKLLEKENQLKEANVKFSVIGVVAFAVFFVVMIIFLIYTRKKNKDLASLNKEIQSANQSLHRSNHEKGKILAVVAHDLRNPIASIQGLSEVMKMDPRTADDLEKIQMIQNTCDSALLIIKDLIDASKVASIIDQNNANEIIDLEYNLSREVQKNRDKAAVKNIQISFESRAGGMNVVFNPNKFSRIIENILSNSIKFTGEKGFISVILSGTRTKALISISDNGVGIPESLLGKVFDQFTEAGRSGTKGEVSVGMGLSIVKEQIEAVGGKVWIESKEGVGTTVFMEFPIIEQ